MRFLDYARNDSKGVMSSRLCFSSPVISTKRSAWRDLMRFLDYARNDNVRGEMTKRNQGVRGALSVGIKSALSLFIVSINQSFLLLDQFLSCFSRAMACSISGNVSKYTNLWQLYFCVKPGINPDLCSATRLAKSFVTPTYSVVSLLLARM